MLILTSYYGDRVILIDTAYRDENGGFTFEDKEKLPGGIYMAVSSDKRKLFEFIVDQSQHFTLNTNNSGLALQMEVSGSRDNQIFFEYIKLNERLYRQNTDFQEQMKGLPEGSKEYLAIRTKMDSINRLSSDMKLKVIEIEPELFVSTLFNAMREIEYPDSIVNSSDSAAVYRYYKSHFWDYFDLSDSRLIRTPMLDKKVDQYFNQLVFQHPDSAIAAIDYVIEMARPTDEVISWLVWQFTSDYQNPEYMGFDVVFIHLVDTYFPNENITNLTPSILQNLQDRANKMRPLVLGNSAPNLILIDTSGNYQSFHSLTNEYVLLFFWDYDCGICKNEIKVLKEIYHNPGFDFEVFGVSVNSDLDKWKESLVEQDFKWINVNGTRSVTQNFHDLYDTYGTPALFILDKEKNIIAKRISADQVIVFLENYNRNID